MNAPAAPATSASDAAGPSGLGAAAAALFGGDAAMFGSGGPSPLAAPDESSPFAAPPSADAAVAAELAAYAPAAAPAAAQPAAQNATFGASAAPVDTNRAVTYAGGDDDLVPIAASPVRSIVATVLGSRRNIAIAAGGALLLVIVLVFALGGSSDNPTAVASKTKTEPEAPVVEPTPEKAPADPVAETPAGSDAEKVAAVETPTETPTETPAMKPTEAAAGSAAQVEPTNVGATATQPKPSSGVAGTAKAVTGAKAAVGGGSKKTLGGKQVVLEYDAQAKEAAKPVATAPKNDQAAILKARAAYAQGNQKLMAGDWNGAILKYRQSLASYPGYVAGYRGLGLAFMQKGDKPKALQALRLYLSSVPGAKDAGLIRKRIQTLQK